MIHGWFDEQGRPYVFAAVALPRLGYTQWVRLLVDTGADATSLHPRDCSGLPYSLLGNVGETTGIGGVSEYFREPALVTFRDIEDSCFQVYAVTIDIARPTEHNGSVPSLLGQDILMNWRVVHDRLTNDLTSEVRQADHVIPV